MFIKLRGLRQHNLKDLDLDIPLGKVIGLCGVSGSGKSSLAFHVIHAEGQRRYVETFSPYVRQFLERLPQPEADSIEHIPPTIALESGTSVKNARSTVGTLTDINDYLKVLYSLDVDPDSPIVQLFCPRCEKPIKVSSGESILKWLREASPEDPFLILAPLEINNPTFDSAQLIAKGFVRIYAHGQQIHLEEDELPPQFYGPVRVVVDRLSGTGESPERVVDSLRLADRMGNGIIEIMLSNKDIHTFSSRLECSYCGFKGPDRRPEFFSFNSPAGACPECKGFGKIIGVNYDLVIPDKRKTLREGAIKPWSFDTFEYEELISFCEKEKIPLDVPFEKLREEDKKKILYGTDEYYGIDGFFQWLEQKRYKVHVRVFLSRYRAFIKCPLCNGTRYNLNVGSVRLLGVPIYELQSWSIARCLDFFEKHQHLFSFAPSSHIVVQEIINRLRLLKELQLGYLSLDRPSRTLSGGEVQRVHLVRVLGSGLSNVLYILDEPSTGLHPRDLVFLIKAVRDFVKRGNTILVIDHDPHLLKSCDHLIELGPQGGSKGGRIIGEGSPEDLAKNPKSITGAYLDKVFWHSKDPCKGNLDSGALIIRNAKANNLKSITVTIPLGKLTGISGVSGAGKTTLIKTVIYNEWMKYKGLPLEGEIVPEAADIEGLELIDRMIFVDHRPLAKTPRSNLLSYSGALKVIRNLLAGTEDAKLRGYGGGMFSFNQPGGRCEVCQGEGYEYHEMQFLSDAYSVCPACKGKRFKPDILEIKYRGWSIADFLEATAEEALEHFADYKTLADFFLPFMDLQLHHLKLGQPLATLSAGEIQRLKLLTILKTVHKLGSKEKIMVLMDEPSRGLHLKELEGLVKIFRSITEQGHTVVMVEHNAFLLSQCNWIITLGPESGEKGGRLLFEGWADQFEAERFFNSSNLPELTEKDISCKTLQEKKRPFYLSREVVIKNVRHHNLAIPQLTIPHGLMTAVVGISGSGKSTLAFDVLFMEGQRRYLECLSNYVRQYFPLPERPKVDLIEGLPPTVAVEQRLSRLGAKSTVGTVTEIYHFLRVLFSKLGEQRCPTCGDVVRSVNVDEMINQIKETIKQYGFDQVKVLSPVVYRRKGIYRDLIRRLRKIGIEEIFVDGNPGDMGKIESEGLSRFSDHTIEAVLPIEYPLRGSSVEWIRKGIKMSGGLLTVIGESFGRLMLSKDLFCYNCSKAFLPLDPRLFSFNSPYGACEFCSGTGIDEKGNVCGYCGGSRLKEQARWVTFTGKTITALTAMTVEEACEFWGPFWKHHSALEGKRHIIEPLRTEVHARLRFLMDVGLSYLTLDRSGDTLSGGEVQRIRLAAHLGSNLYGVLYVLDEPTIGLHPRDNDKLIRCLQAIKEKGNTVVVVEHDLDVVKASDMVIELGPGAGRKGGRIVTQGRWEELLENKDSLVGKSLREESYRGNSENKEWSKWLAFKGITKRYFNRVNVAIPLETITCITGVSGSGKSTLVFDVIKVVLEKAISGKAIREGETLCESISGVEHIHSVKEVDHQPIGRTFRSAPATYIGVWEEIRDIFAALPASKLLGLKASDFSFNIPGGRCETCKGQGVVVEKMGFLPDVSRVCPTCGGSRFKREILSVFHKNKNISQVLDMTFDEAYEYFKAHISLAKAFEMVKKLGLNYLTLGQASPTLSGGEAQRIKLVKELQKNSRPTLFILDEPTTGLHKADIVKLMGVLRDLTAKGHTIVVIEHNMDFIAGSDYIIDIGPGGGPHGGRIVAQGRVGHMKRFGELSQTAQILSQRMVSG